MLAYHSSCNILDVLDAELAFLELPVPEYVSPVAPAIDEEALLHLQTLQLGPTMLALGRENIQNLHEKKKAMCLATFAIHVQGFIQDFLVGVEEVCGSLSQCHT